MSRLFGRAGGEEATISLTRVRVTPDDIVGDVNGGAAVAAVLNKLGVTFTAGRFIGLGRWALEQAIEHSTSTAVGDVSLAADATVRNMLADSAIDIYGARRMALDCAQRIHAERPAVKEAAMARTAAVEACYRVYERCMHIHGGVGLTNDTRLFDGWHQARIVMSAGGPGDVTRSTLAQRLLDGDLSF